MKQRTFFTTLVLFLFFFNLGILIISVAQFKDMVKEVEERSLREHYFIVSAFIKDLQALESRGLNPDDSLNSLLKPYSYLTGDKNTVLALYKNRELVYFNQFAEVLQNNNLPLPEGEDRLVAREKMNNLTYTVVAGKLPAPYHSYTMVYLYNMTEDIKDWNKMKNVLFLAGLILSCLLAAGLLFLLNRIFKPLVLISQISRDLAAGSYETRLPVAGHDELSEMAQSFNYMAEEIQRQMKELAETAEKKQQFIDNFAHELRTPLTAIHGYAEYLQKAVLTEDERLSALGYIMSESRRLQTIACQLLELANLRHSGIVWEKHNIAELFQGVKQTLEQKITEKEIEIDFRCATDVIWGDADLLKSLFINIVDNAIKACKVGGKITVAAAEDNGRIIVSIQDNGKGMPPEILAQITEPFYRGEKSRNRRESGAGLGLAICRQIVLRHGGKLEFSSCPGKGTTVKITFTTWK